MKINYTIGDATRPEGDGNKVIVHICNDVGGWGAGFVLALSKRWKQPEQEYRAKHAKSFHGGPALKLGSVQFVPVEADITVANLVGQCGVGRNSLNPPIRYDAVREGLHEVCKHCVKTKSSVHMPRIGCGLAGGRWEMIEPIIQQELCDRGFQVTVYDLK